jgi:capsule biosynthesis phosphatase
MAPPNRDRVVFDIDGVIARKNNDLDYGDRNPHLDVVEQLREYDRNGYYIILYTARNMNTHEGRIGKINADTAKTLLQWLEKHQIPHDEIHYGKPWCGHNGFYVDDKAIRPSELLANSQDEIDELLNQEKKFLSEL